MVGCRYAIVRFMPYPESGEFANVGIVLACPAKGYFGYRLETRRYARLTQFFRGLDRRVYLESIRAFGAELQRVQLLVQRTPSETEIRHLFQALVHPREAILQFAHERPLLVENPAKALQQLFRRYVEHDFITPEYKENQLVKRVQHLVTQLKLEHPFRRGKVEAVGIEVTFPLLQTIDNQVTKVIKPFFLGQDEPNKIYNHGDKWLGQLRRLHEHDKLPARVLFTVEGPSGNDRKDYRKRAFEEICKGLTDFAEVVSTTQEQEVIRFATQ